MYTEKTKLQKILVRSMAFFLSMIAGYLVASQLQAQSTVSKNPNSTLWKVSGNGLAQPSYLFGTYHLIKSGFLPQDGKVMKAFQSADGIAVEMEIDSSQLGLIGGYSVMQGNVLSKLLNEEEYKIVDQEVQTLIRQPLETLDQLKPMSVMLFLSLTYATKVAPELLQYDGSPLDQYFVEAGREKGKSIHTFESMIEQMELLYNNSTVEEQAEQLVKFVKDKKKVAKYSRDLVDLYVSENIDKMESISAEWGDSFGGMEALLDDRNNKWMKSIPQLISQKSMFVAVGALHLPGESGLIRLLQKQGYTVEPVH